MTQLRAALGDVVIDPAGLTRDDWLDLLMTHRLQPSFPADQLLAVHDYPAASARWRGCAMAAERRRGRSPNASSCTWGRWNWPTATTSWPTRPSRAALRPRPPTCARSAAIAAPPRDERLLAALAAGFPDCAGVALGVDRLLMAMLGTDRIADVLAFDFGRG